MDLVLHQGSARSDLYNVKEIFQSILGRNISVKWSRYYGFTSLCCLQLTIFYYLFYLFTLRYFFFLVGSCCSFLIFYNQFLLLFTLILPTVLVLFYQFFIAVFYHCPHLFYVLFCCCLCHQNMFIEFSTFLDADAATTTNIVYS